MKCGSCKYFKNNVTPGWCLLQSVNKPQRPEYECDVDSYSYSQMDVEGMHFKKREKKK